MKNMPMMKRVGKVANNEEGYIMMMSLFVMMILILMGIALAVMGMQEFELASRVKMMDQAYLIADAGVNSAAVTLETNPAFKDAVDPKYVAPYTSAIATNAGNPGGGGTEFGGSGDVVNGTKGKFTYWVYQSEQSSDPSYKVIKSKGTITSQGKTVERIIVARLVLGAGGQDYDASFDYLVYNGCSDDLNHGVWPKPRAGFGDWGYLSGQFTFDGSNTYNGHVPKGAVYTRGSIEIPTSLIGGVTYKGNIVATDNIKLQNQWNISGIWRGGGGIDIQGNAVAGIDGTGTATATTTGTAGNAISMSGYLCAPQDVTVTTVGNINFSSAISLGGIVSGGSVSSTGTATIGGSLALGNIFSVGRTTLKSNFSGGVTYGNINTGRDVSSPYIGLYAETAVSGGISGTNVYSLGQVYGRTTLAFNMSLGSVYAGSDSSTAGGPGGTGINLATTLGQMSATLLQTTGKVYIRQTNLLYASVPTIIAGTDSATGHGGIGVDISSTGAVNGTGNITAQGNINVSGTGLGTQTGNWWSGYDIPFSLTTIGASIGNLSANHDLTFTIGAIGFGVGKLWAGNDLVVNVNQVIGGGSLGYMVAYHNVILKTTNGIGGNGVGNITAGYDAYVNSKIVAGGLKIGVIQAGHDIARKNPNSVPPYTGDDAVMNITVGSVSVGGFVAGNDCYMNFSVGAGGTSIAQGAMVGNHLRFDNDSTINTVSLGGIPAWSNSWSVIGGRPRGLTGENISCGSTWFGGFSASKPVGAAYDIGGDWGNDKYANIDGLRGWTPAAYINSYTAPGEPGIPATPNAVLHPPSGGPPGPPYVGPVGLKDSDKAALATQLWKNPPTVDATTMLHAAGLSKEVNILTPNWAYFETLARENDVANGPETKICPNLNCRRTIPSDPPGSSHFPSECPTCHTDITSTPVGPAHMLYEGSTTTGDSDPSTQGIQLIWDNSNPYSSNEVVYNGDKDVTIYIKIINWQPLASTFTGTIVSQGNVVLDSNDSTLSKIKTGQTLNIVSGKDISKSTSGYGFIPEDSANLHMWAAHDISIENMRLSLIDNITLYGSFTAGNQVNFKSNAFYDVAEFKWSRWALDPLAWAPAFKVLDWKEI